MKRFLLASIFAAPLIFSGCNGSSTGPAEVQRKQITGVETVIVSRKAMPEAVEAAGAVKASTVSVISSKVMGTVTAINVREGERVRKGQLLLTIDDSDVAQRVAGASAGLNEARLGLENAKKQMELAEITFQRYQRLHEAKAISRQEFDNVSLQRDQARIGYEAMKETVQRATAGAGEAKVYKGYTRVSAPFAGVVSGKKIEEGSMAAPGMPLLVVEDDSSYVLEASLDGRLAGSVRPGIVLRAIADSGREYKARVTEVAPSIDPATRTFLVKASIKGEGLRSGLFARVFVTGAERQALAVPASAIAAKGQLTGVFVVDEKGVVSYRLIRAGNRINDDVEVISGLSAGERVISKGVDRAMDGGRLESAK